MCIPAKGADATGASEEPVKTRTSMQLRDCRL